VGNPRVLHHVSGRMKKAPSPPRVDRAGMARAVEALLKAAGIPRPDPNLDDTPSRVATAWSEEFLDGYGQDPAKVLGKTYPAPEGSAGELVVLTDVAFHSMCPHHLLPYEGLAHIAYVPKGRVVGFGRIADLLRCFAHRLVLQEALARDVARALAEHLDSSGTACIVEAKQACLRLRGHTQRTAKTHSEAYDGILRKDKALRAELWARIASRPS
jgi:GTP cyclohydrolase I